MTTRNVEPGKAFINDTFFPISGPVRVTDATQQHRVVKRVWRDHRGGMGVNREGPNDPPNFARDTSWDGRWPGHLIPPGQINETEPSLNTAGGSGIALVSELSGKLVTTAGSTIFDYLDGGTGWTSRDSSIPAAPVGIKNGNLGGTEYLVVPYTSGYTYASDVTTWRDKTINVVNVEFHDYKLWGIDATGQLWFLTANAGIAGTAVNHAKLNLSHGEVVTGLFRARAKADNEAFVLYATTSKRLYVHNAGQNRFDEVPDISIGDNNEVAHEVPHTVYKGKIYLASGRSIIEYDPVNLAIDYIGFDRFDGLPAGLDGRITCMASNTHEMFVGTKSVLSGTDTAVVMAWNGNGWRRAWTDPDTLEIVDSIHVARVPNSSISADAGGDVEYLWVGTTSKVHHVLINNSETRSPNISGWLSAGSAAEAPFRQHKLPIFSVPEVVTVALRLLVEAAGVSSSVGIDVFVDFDNAGQTKMTNPEFTTDTTFPAANDRIEGVGTTTFRFPTGANDRSGTEFRDIQIAVDSDTSVTTKGADILSITLEYLEIEEIKESFECVLDFREGASALPVEELRAALATAKGLKKMVEFAYQDEESFYVKIWEEQGDEATGFLEEGLVRIRMEVM